MKLKKPLLKRKTANNEENEIWKIELILKREKKKTKNGEIIVAHRKARGRCLGKRWSAKANYFKMIRFIIKKGGRKLTVGESDEIRKVIAPLLQEGFLPPKPQEIKLPTKPKRKK